GFRTVASHAVGSEDGLASFRIGLHVLRQLATVQGHAQESGNVAYALVADDFAPGRHHALAATHDGGLDGGGFATPAPVVVGQVREAVGTLGVGAVAHRAVGREHAAAHFQGFRILGHFLDRHGGVLGED